MRAASFLWNFGSSAWMQSAFILLMALYGTAPAAYSQSTSQVQGTIQDTAATAVPGAEVKVTQTDTGVVRTVISGADGSYVLANLPTGPYRLEASKPGFRTYVQT